MKSGRLVIAAVPFALLVVACSETTRDNAEEMVERAAADTEENAAVVGEVVRDGAIVAADEISEGSAELRDELVEDKTDAPSTDGQLDGTD